MLTLITGQPGNGKTLHTLELVEKLRLQSNREVYFHGINELTLPWKPFEDPKAWQDLPDGSIVVVDEAYQFFGTRPQGQKPPDYVDALARHRHRGFDLFFIGQRHVQFDTFVRGLVGRHIEVVRRFGRGTATLYQWEKCVDPNSEINKRDALKTPWPYPQQFFTAYKSAEIHTVKKDFPLRKVALLVGALLGVAAGGGYVAWHVTHGAGIPGAEPVAKDDVVASQGQQRIVGNPWAFDVRTARLVDVPQSAPLFDDLQQQRSQPAVAGCMMLAIDSAVQCTCTTVQGSKLELPVSRCVAMVKRGWFDGTREPVDIKAENIARLEARDGAGESNAGTGGAPSTVSSRAAGTASSGT